jgi:serine-type D-Ala-D-Ala carboxypeptidase (penicillin-binding protein 5/6)
VYRRWSYFLSAICTSAMVLSTLSSTVQTVHANTLPGVSGILSSTSGYSGKNASAKTNVDLAREARSAVIMDALTGKVLYEKDGHERLPMASITKIMTMLLIMDAIDSGQLKYTDKVKASEYASSMGGSQIFLEPEETMTVEQMLKGIAIASANDACVAMAEHLEGTEEAFVARMNQKAQELDMEDTHFANCNGLPAKNHYSSAHDIAIMSRALLNYPDITRFTSVYSDYLRKDTSNPLWLVNTNKLVRFYDGVDGLKTGYTGEAKYCLSATAKKDGFRVIAVVMGEPRPKTRNAEVTGLLNWSFHNFTTKTIYKPGTVISAAPVEGGVESNVNVCTHAPIGLVTKRGVKAEYRTKIEVDDLEAPVRKGQKIGKLKVFDGENCIMSAPLYAQTDVAKSTFFQRVGRTFKGIVTFGTAK